MIDWARMARLTCDKKLSDSNGDLRSLFDMILNVFLRQGEDLLKQYGEDEEIVFYDFAIHYDKGKGYWKRMGEKIFGDDLWGYEQGVDTNVTPYDRFMIVSVDNAMVDKAVERVKKFGWWCSVASPVESLGTTPLVVSPVALEMV